MHKRRPIIRSIKILSIADVKKAQSYVQTHYDYQPQLTAELDNYRDKFTQDVINKIVLWKTNRYIAFSTQQLDLINSVLPEYQILDKSLTKEVLSSILSHPDMRLSILSTILRFKNPNVYQIIDYHVFRALKGQRLFFPDNISQQINLYLDYLEDLKDVCRRFSLDYRTADRTLYRLDRHVLNPP